MIYIQKDLSYAHQEKDAPAIEEFGIWMLCDVENVNSTIEQKITRHSDN